MIEITIGIEELEDGMSVGFGIHGNDVSSSEQIVASRFIGKFKHVSDQISKESGAMKELIEE